MEYKLLNKNEISLMKEVIEDEICYVYNLEDGDR